MFIATTNFDKDGGGLVGASAKITYFKAAKEVFKYTFPSHELWRDEEWWGQKNGVFKRFEKAIERHKIEDPEISEGRKSEPLYRDVKSSSAAIRAVYSGDIIVDAKSIATSMIKNGKRDTAKDAGKLLEFTLCRHAIGRGGEHAFLRYNEGTYDWNFNAPDFDWSIIKQTERQCMLFFCDRFLYCLCPFFAFGVYFLFGGPRRDGCSDATRDFIFPHLHSIRKDSVAAGLTASMRAHIPKDERHRFTSRSTRKGCMTENRIHPDLSLQEEYARSGHTHASGSNKNAEGYIESTPAMNAPGGMAIAGYVNCHTPPQPYNFSCLGEDDVVVGSVKRLIDELFVNDVPQLQFGTPLRRLLVTSAARLVGSYNELVRDIAPADPMKHDIVLKICTAARRAAIDDNSVSLVPRIPRWLHILKSWSSKIKNDFNLSNPMKPPEDAGLSQQIVGLGNLIDSLSHRITALEAKVDSRAEDKAMGELVCESNKMTTLENENLKRELADQRREIRRLKAALNNLTSSHSPSTPSTTTRKLPAQLPMTRLLEVQEVLQEVDAEEEEERAAAANDDGTGKDEVQVVEQQQPPAKKQRTSDDSQPSEDNDPPPPRQRPPPPAAAAAAAAVSVNDALNGIPEQWTGVSGITVQNELERLWEQYHSKRSSTAEADDNDDAPPSLPNKTALYDKDRLLCKAHPAFIEFKEQARYRKGMTIVAMAMTDAQWALLLEGTMESLEMRQLFKLVEENAMLTAYELEVQCGKRQAGSEVSDRLMPTLHSLGNRWNNIVKNFKELGKSDVEIERMVHDKVHGVGTFPQRLIANYFAPV